MGFQFIVLFVMCKDVSTKVNALQRLYVFFVMFIFLTNFHVSPIFECTFC